MKFWILFGFLTAYQPVFLSASNVLVVFPHIYYSHFKETSQLISQISSYDHNVTFVSPYPNQVENDDGKITEISIEGILEPLEEFATNFYQNENSWYSYWSHLKYAKDIGYEYSKRVLENENVTKLISSESTFDVVIIELMSADALTILAHVFQCPLVVLLSEPLGVFYDNYVIDNTPWKQYNEIRNMHHWAFKELYRESVSLPAQNRLAKRIVPDAPDLRDILYETSLVLMPSYEMLTYMVPKYPHVKQIGGFNLEGKFPNVLEANSFNTSEAVVVVSSNIPVDIFAKLLDIPSIKFVYTPQVSDVVWQGKVELLIGDGDVYDTSKAISNLVKVLVISQNRWQQYFLIDKLVDEGMALQVSIEDDFSKIIEAINHLIHDRESTSKVWKAWKLMNVDQPESDYAISWLEYVLSSKGASLLRPSHLRNSLQHNRITIIIILIVIDIALFLLFYWIITHVHKVVRFVVLKSYGVIRNLVQRRAQPQTTISYIPIDEKKFAI